MSVPEARVKRLEEAARSLGVAGYDPVGLLRDERARLARRMIRLQVRVEALDDWMHDSGAARPSKRERRRERRARRRLCRRIADADARILAIGRLLANAAGPGGNDG